MTRLLGSLQVASLLVSASYGIGFLFGFGELAIAHGMAGSIYGIATGQLIAIQHLICSSLSIRFRLKHF